MNSFLAHVVIVVALVVVGVTFPAIVYSTTCQSNPCSDNPDNPCVTAGKGTKNERCAGTCKGPAGCTCTRNNTKENCRCMKLNL
jgi:hypothetical protein